jgi:RNA polymerase-interacting CarD/CdnL/TRCF family regulator
MAKKRKYKVGDKIVSFGQIYRIFKIRKKKFKDGTKRVIFYRPYYKNQENRTIICSIPVENICMTEMRKPISRTDLQQLLEKLSRKANKVDELDTNKAKEMLGENNPNKTVGILRILWRVKNDEDMNFTKSQKDVLNLAIERLVEEVAFVGKMSIDKAGEKIKDSLNKTISA